jgi:hypothetical protein
VSLRPQRRIALLLATALLLVSGLAAASGEHASWTWAGTLPGESTSATDSSAARELAAAGEFVLLAAAGPNGVEIGTANAGRPAQLEPVEQLAAGQPLITYSAAAADPQTQALVGVARADVDRVVARLADGSEADLPLNQWRGFSHSAATSGQAVVEVQAYANGSPVGAARVPQTTSTAAAATATGTPVYGVFRASLTEQTIRIARVDSRTLHPLPGRSLLLRAQSAGPAALSPDQQQLALLTSDSVTSQARRLLIIDLRQMRVTHAYAFASSVIRGLSWPRPDRLLELRQTMGPPYNRNVASRAVWAVDPATGARLGSGTLTRKLAIRQLIATSDGFVGLLGTSGLHAHEESQVVSVDADARVRSTTLPLGSIRHARLESRLAVDSSGNHAYVVAPGAVVFDIDLATMGWTRHEIAAPASQKSAAIGILDAATIGGQVAVAGALETQSGGAAEGIVLVDPNTWTARMLDPRASRFAVLGDRLLAYGDGASLTRKPGSPIGHGVTLYDASGSRLAHLYGRRSVDAVTLTPGYGHLLYSGKHSVRMPPPGTTHPLRAHIYDFGPNDQLIFHLAAGAPAGAATLSAHKPPLGQPLLIFRGSDAIGEAADRQPAGVTKPAAARPSSTTTSSVTTTRTLQRAAAQPRYGISNPGRPVAAHGHRLFDERFKYQLYLLGTIAGRAFYRVQVAPHFRCYGSGDAGKIGLIGSLGCPTVVGAYPLQLEDTLVEISARRKTQTPTYLRIGGLVTDGAASVELRDSAGKTRATTTVVNNLFAFPKPYPPTMLRIVVLDANGNELKPQPAAGQHQQPPPFLFGPRATKVLPSRLQQPLQHAAGDGVEVTVGRNGVVVMKIGAIDTQTRRQISGQSIGASCFVVSPTIRHTRGAGVSLARNGDNETAFKILGYIKPPFDGCEITGSYGHRWRDQWGTHSPVEVPLTVRGKRYFDNRAAARDLALFVRSKDMHRLRKLHGPGLIAALRARYGDRVAILASATASAPAGEVGIWADATRTLISERSTAGGRFYVEFTNGKITKENVRGLAFVF